MILVDYGFIIQSKIFNITTSIDENVFAGVEVTNSWKIKYYKGPKSPSCTHRYYFKLYACNVEKMKANTLEQFYDEIKKVKLVSLQQSWANFHINLI